MFSLTLITLLASTSTIVLCHVPKMSVGYDVYPRPLVTGEGRVIYLCSDQTFTSGRLLAFSAWFNTSGRGHIRAEEKVRFQIWRPLSAQGEVAVAQGSADPGNGLAAVSKKTFTLVQEKAVSPVVGFYQTDMTEEHIAMVQDGDTLAIIYDGDGRVPIAASEHMDMSRDTYIVDLGEKDALPSVGDDVTFTARSFKYQFSISAIYEPDEGHQAEISEAKTVKPSKPVRNPNVLEDVPEGSFGPPGATGHTGAFGPPGLQGERGPQGATGELGPRGGRGKTGSTGATGPSGDRGEKGETGDRGMKGYDGHTGPSGPTGVAGHTGHTGPEGREGERGRTGAAGATGGVGLPGQPYIDINECGGVEHGCDHGCEDKLGHYVCVCRHGYRLAENGRSCPDFDECSEQNAGCEHACVNIEGSFLCSCGPGLKLGPDGHSCQDIGECDVNNGDCATGDTCVDVYGSFYCLRLGVSAADEPLAVFWGGAVSNDYSIMVENKLVNYRVVLGIIIWLAVLSIICLSILICFCVRKGREGRKKKDYIAYAKSIRRASRGTTVDTNKDTVFY